ncbi:FCD domain-containing protein [Roseomonas nepalensis]|uniref:FCD domain-containing protein n=1 Tax=Muricoccus nepalensis TaxID=1854500 RepID=A0A502FCK9_9PROT|nr:GntR family transcriptional regulator [Roseomonas nepalensis]TPG47074.1 FCD domain-containing protein [Roseomonas nepalensis]
MPRPPAALLHRALARAIVERLRAEPDAAAEALSENGLARRLGTSRSPVRGALRLLLEAGVLARREDGRLALRRLPPAGENLPGDPLPGENPATPAPAAAERLYWRLAADRLAGALPDVVGEADLARRYGASRGPVHRALLQAAGEGWVERAPSGTWRFLSLIDGAASYDESYRFRRAIEPAALRDPAFRLPAPTLERLRREQRDLLGRAGEAGPREVFELNSGFHLALVQASNNRFLADAALRLTRLRRVVGYVIALDQGRLAAQSAEHLAILDRLEAGDRESAARLLLRHLDAGRASKARLLADARLKLDGLAAAPGDG